MSYGRILKPRIYACQAAHMALRGYAPTSIVSIQSNGEQIGSNITDLIAMRPQAVTAIDTSGETTDVIISFDFPQSVDISFVAVLCHNMRTVGSVFRLYRHTAAITSINIGSATEIALTDVVGGLTSGTVDSNDSYIGTFATTFAAHYAIRISESGATFGADIQIGSIMLGTYWDAPYAPDLQVRRRLMHDGVKMNETRGGKRHASIGWLTGSEGAALPFGAPFRTDAVDTIYEHHTGRRQYEMTFSRLADTAVEEEDFSEGILGDGTATAKWRDIMSLTGAGALPSIFTPDGTSTTSGDYLFARVEPGDETQVAPKVWTVSATISEEF
jgi:hypothetical protein